MRTVLNVLNFVLGGFATTLSWLFATLVSIVLIFTLPLTRSCWEITKLSFIPYGNEAVHVDELNPENKSALRNRAEHSVADFLRLVAVRNAYFCRYCAVHHNHWYSGGDREL